MPGEHALLAVIDTGPGFAMGEIQLVAAAIASLAAITMELGNLKSLPQSQQVLHVTLVAVTFAAS